MDTKDRILHKADELFRKFGLRAVTLDEIASNLGISKKTIYQFFADKDALVDEIMMQEFAKTNNDCELCKTRAQNAVEEIFLLMQHLDDDFRNLNPLILHDLKKFHHTTFIKFNQYMHENMVKMIMENIEKGIEEGNYRNDFDIEILARFRMASIWLMFDQEIFPASKYNLVNLSHQIMEHFLHGIVSEKGYQLINKYKQV
ncbi:MAG: TetR/AcrR family transcriptional regulator [Chitinophagaceae bacterium]|jgi:AcrR family transcriptional regulator